MWHSYLARPCVLAPPAAAIPGEIWPRRRQRRLRPPDPSSVPPTHYQGLIRQAQSLSLIGS